MDPCIYPCKFPNNVPEKLLLSMSCELHSKLLKWGYIGGYLGEYYRVIMGDTRSLDHGSFEVTFQVRSIS